MSRMTKFLKQTCQVRAYSVDSDGAIEMDRFGKIVYQEAVTCKCRREQTTRRVLAENGAVFTAATCYFLDESVEVKVDYLIDGLPVLTCESYTNELGGCEGYEVYV